MSEKAKLILASGSPRRAKILRDLGIDFEIVRTDAPEMSRPEDPEGTVRANALAKGEAARRSGRHVLSADTVVWLDGRIYGKPRDLAEARAFLRELSGRTHAVFTGVAYDGDVRVVRSSVKFRELSDAVIDDYVSRVNPTDRAGAYDIDDHGDMIIESRSGSYENIMGLPIGPLVDWGLASVPRPSQPTARPESSPYQTCQTSHTTARPESSPYQTCQTCQTFKTSSTLVSLLAANGLTCATAESCTGGGIGRAITAVPGSSDVFKGGVISYSNEAKRDILGVAGETLASFGAVSSETAAEMAEGARRLLKSDLAVSVTGIAGPGGGSAEKPVGLVWFGLATANGTRTEKAIFSGDRERVRGQTVMHALGMLSVASLEASSR